AAAKWLKLRHRALAASPHPAPAGLCKLTRCRVCRPDTRIRNRGQIASAKPPYRIFRGDFHTPLKNSHFFSLFCDFSLRSAIPLAIVPCGPSFFVENQG